MRLERWMRARATCGLALLVVVAPGLAGCESVLTEGAATAAGVAGTAAASLVTSSATAAAAIGLGVNSAADEGLKYVRRRVHNTEQDAIAASAGPLADGAVAPWQASHSLPIERDEHGQVVVAHSFGVGQFRCKDIVFSVETEGKAGPQRAFYTATVCQDGGAWRWASAEPATARWGGLQQ